MSVVMLYGGFYNPTTTSMFCVHALACKMLQVNYQFLLLRKDVHDFNYHRCPRFIALLISKLINHSRYF